MFYAHSKEGTTKDMWQLLEDHLIQTAKLAEQFAQKLNAGKLGYTAGILHDIGKYSTEFQARLEGSKMPVDHSTAGLKEVYNIYDKVIAKTLSYIIGGHHSGLPDAGSENYEGSLINRRKKEINDFSYYRKEIHPPDLSKIHINLKLSGEIAFSFYFFIKMMFSCLVDADYLDTEKFMAKSKSENRGGYASMIELLSHFKKHMEDITARSEKNTINRYRGDILKKCIDEAKNKPGFYSLTVPTGGGKTLSSMAFALKHAIKNNLDRIIYVIPYTSIIEQNAEIFRSIFKEENVLEHHSNFDFKEGENFQEISKKLHLASENWDIPIIITTNVQFFESIFANKSSKLRKIHNLARSVIILDEAQMLPIKLLKASILALCELVNNYHCSIVLCTATQPNLDSLLPENIKIKEMMDSPQSLYEKFRRTQIKNIGEINDAQLIAELRNHSQVLCIVNTREHARRIYEKLTTYNDDNQGANQGIYHLSTRLYPLHRKRVIKEIKKRLEANKKGVEKLECKVISTQLIEAGVDIDFPVVYRAMAGIDSIAQAAGRCNREGKAETADVFVFSSTEKHGKPPREIEINVSEAKSVFRNYNDSLSLEGINKYFDLLYDLKNIDQKDILKDIKERAKDLDYPFAEIARKYKIIENKTIAVIVPADDKCRKLIERLKHAPYTYKILRKLQPYTVNIYENEFKKLLETGGISVIDFDKSLYAIASIKEFYNDETGVVSNRDDLLNDVLLC